MASSSLASTQIQERLAALLALIAGYVDGYGYISYNTYLSFMSGNTTLTGYRIGEEKLASALPPLVAIVFFVIGVFAGTLLTHSGTRRSRRLVFVAVAVLLALILGAMQVSSLPTDLQIATLSLAMGIMNTALGHVGAQLVNLTYVTGTLSRIGRHLAMAFRHSPLADAQGPWDTHRRRALLLAIVWSAFFIGALLAGAATPQFAARTLLPPILVLLVLAASNGPAVNAPESPKPE